MENNAKEMVRIAYDALDEKLGCDIEILKIDEISNLPKFLNTITVVTSAITASQINSVHHQLPTVYTIAETT